MLEPWLDVIYLIREHLADPTKLWDGGAFRHGKLFVFEWPVCRDTYDRSGTIASGKMPLQSGGT